MCDMHKVTAELTKNLCTFGSGRLRKGPVFLFAHGRNFTGGGAWKRPAVIRPDPPRGNRTDPAHPAVTAAGGGVGKVVMEQLYDGKAVPARRQRAVLFFINKMHKKASALLVNFQKLRNLFKNRVKIENFSEIRRSGGYETNADTIVCL